ncbi:SRPBCC family protein [Phytomonospora sp. NPDC050363]|uniref:SRPBCC family protein n=1 Tax=Phytomonospora sp. NPDC050363 TaxID=3155642 RepID=UPI0033CA20DD
MQKTYEKSVNVDVDLRTAYDQWTQFESFPQFMDGVDEVRQLGPERTHWKTSIAGVEREFDAEIVEQRPDERIAWQSLDGPKQAGAVDFQRVGDQETRVILQMVFEPEGAAETAGAATGLVGMRIEGDLERFKAFIESRGTETGAFPSQTPPPTM